MLPIAGVTSKSAKLDDFHRLWFCKAGKAKCSLPPCTCTNPPCDSCKVSKSESRGDTDVQVVPGGVHAKAIGYIPQGKTVGQHGWCRANPPSRQWSATPGCVGAQRSVTIKVLTYNLFWWHLFGVRGGANRMAGKLIERTGSYDFMGFQECDDVNRIIGDANLARTHDVYRGVHAVSNAWAKATWRAIANGHVEIAEDHRSQWYGKRAVVWSRLQHREQGKIVFFMNFHGPLPVGGAGGGFCGAEATAYNMMKVIGDHARMGDCVVLVGDFNAVKKSKLLNTIGKYLKHQFQGKSFGGVDNFYTNGCATLVSTKNLGNGGSDHDALSATFQV